MSDQQRGSVSPVFIMVLSVVILLLGAFLDREWLNYKIHLAETIADFAAEAGARSAEVWDTIEVAMYQIRYEPVTICLDQPKCTEKTTVLVGFRYDQVRRVVARDADIRRNWPLLAGCGIWADEPNWRCSGVSLVSQEVRYPTGTEELVKQVFRANWQDQPLARLIGDIAVTPRTGDRKVDVHVTVEIRSVTGLVGWRQSKALTGSAVTRIERPELTLP